MNKNLENKALGKYYEKDVRIIMPAMAGELLAPAVRDLEKLI